MGDEVNLSARLMQRAQPDEVLADRSVRRATEANMVWEDLAPFTPKGKSQPMVPSRLIGPRDRQSTRLHLPDYALPVVGRERELELILSRLDSVVGGRRPGGRHRGRRRHGQVATAGRGAATAAAARHRASSAASASRTASTPATWSGTTSGGPSSVSTRPRPAAEQIGQLERHLREIDPLLVDRTPLLGAVVNVAIPDNELTESFDAALRKTSLESLLVALPASPCPPRRRCCWCSTTATGSTRCRTTCSRCIGRAIADVPVMIIITYRPALTAHLEAPRISLLAHFTEVPLADLPPAALAERDAHQAAPAVRGRDRAQPRAGGGDERTLAGQPVLPRGAAQLPEGPRHRSAGPGRAAAASTCRTACTA